MGKRKETAQERPELEALTTAVPQDVPVNRLTENPDRVDSVPARRVEQVELFVQKYGVVEPILCVGDVVLHGWEFVLAARNLGMETISAFVLDPAEYDEEKRAALTISLQARGEWDSTKLGDVLEELRAADLTLDVAGFTALEVDQALFSKERYASKARVRLEGQKQKAGIDRHHHFSFRVGEVRYRISEDHCNRISRFTDLRKALHNEDTKTVVVGIIRRIIDEANALAEAADEG